MKRFLALIILISAGFFSTRLLAQVIQKAGPGLWPEIIQFKNNAPAFQRGSVIMVDAAGKTSSLTNGKIGFEERDIRGMEHFRYQQYHQGIPIEHASLAVHVKAGRIGSQNGKWVKDFPDGLPANPSLNPSQALNKALLKIGAQQYKWQMADEEAFLKRETGNPNASFYPKPQLVYYSGERDLIPAALRLAYKFDIYAQQPLSRQIVFVDAQNGEILGTRELIHTTNAPGTAITAYSSSQSIMADYTGATYRLRETGRGNGINTFNLQKGVSYSTAIDFTDADNNWNNVNANLDQYATDAHWGTEKTYDYFLSQHNRNSIDNAGFALNSYVHYSTNYFNAFWDGSRMTYGDGDAAHGNKPLTSLDVCGHEITHGLTERTSALVYSYESGAMNEGFSDIFGTAIEFYARPGNANWLVGSDFYTIRSMSNPNTFSHPDTYEGNFWYTGSGDNGGVHFNSGVLNFWFYLLVSGGSGTNDHGTAYSVTGIGMDKAAAIAYRLNTYYLTPTSDYYTARTLGVLAAEDLFGSGSNEAIQTANAWTAVGLYAPSCDPVNGVTASSVTDLYATLKWNASLGAINYKVEYKLHSATTWYSAGTTTDTTVSLGGLNTNALYDWRVRSSCNGNFSYGQFTTLPPICRPPTGLVAMIISTSSVALEWNYQYFATAYVLDYKKSTDTDWTRAGTYTGNTATLSGLEPTTLYDYRLRSNCSSDSSSFASSQFDTGWPACGIPTSLTTTYTAGNTTTVSWDPVPGAVAYTVQMDWEGQGFGSPALDTLVTTNSFSISGFMSGLRLDWRVRSICASGVSPYAVSQLTTPCGAPINGTSTGITPNGAILNWTATADNSIFGFTLQYKKSTTSSWTSTSPFAGTTYTLSNLAAGTVYDWRVRQNCYSINSVYFQGQFTTPCTIVPAGLKATNVMTNRALLQWNAISGVLSYNVRYKLTTSSTWIAVNNLTTNSVTVMPLTPGSNYEFQVMAVCAAGSSSYSPSAGFTTYCASSGTNSQEWIDYFQLGSITHVSGANPSGYVHTAFTTNLNIGSTGNAGIISAGFSSAVRNQWYAIYIDLNRNGSYADAGEMVAGVSSITGSGNFNFSINIPATATPGLTGMRVVMLRQASGVTMGSCVTGKRGETEDYFVNLVSPPAFGAADPAIVKQGIPEGSEITVSPNPSRSMFRIDLPFNYTLSAYEIVNMKGATIQKVSGNQSRSLSVNLSGQPNGVYLLRITDISGMRQVLKLLKQ